MGSWPAAGAPAPTGPLAAARLTLKLLAARCLCLALSAELTRLDAQLDMQNTFVSQDEALRDGMASGHRRWFGFPVPFTLPYHRAELPAGYIISSAEDMTHFLIAQLNGGRYREHAVLSPDGIALTHTEPLPRTYAMGWENDRLDAHLVIDHDGGTANFQSSVFFDPEARVGVFIAANVINGLDAVSSPPGSSPVDGVTVRAMAKSVLSLATNRPWPAQGLRIERSTLIFDLVLAALTGVLVVSLARMPGRLPRRPADRAPRGGRGRRRRAPPSCAAICPTRPRCERRCGPCTPSATPRAA